MADSPIQLSFEGGTLVLEGADHALLATLPGCRLDPRTNQFRAEARCYRVLIEHLRQQKVAYQDGARNYEPLELKQASSRTPFPHQSEALEAWWRGGGRGIVVLPTGTGKTFLAVLAIERAKRPTLVVTPTIDLLHQWHDELASAFNVPIGLVGGGSYDFQLLTITTYDSAYIHLERWGNRYGLIVFDECHHLPGPSYLLTAVGSIAPYRLGLTATPERADQQEHLLPELIGPLLFRREIKELSGSYLAEYRTERRYVGLSADEQARYDQMRGEYRRFVDDRRISFGSPQGWQRFLQESSRSPEGRAAFRAYLEQKRIAQAAPAKLELLEKLLTEHAADRVLIFTADNATVYQIARRFLIPAITHQTKARERREVLQRFHDGIYPIVVTSQVLNEGVNVPAASVGIVLSGTGSVREHVQRLGRLLRKYGDKQATLYEVIARGTAEEFTSDRRRQHDAYEKNVGD
ncbi:MAG TPA: DEAD/DEAH box helicase family protein [Gemmataceae bacterium]|nr:DEAD/DEAH box helicase family protein [Gemmataceae bacterium]